jgi:cellulose synthase (UDP-forming)
MNSPGNRANGTKNILRRNSPSAGYFLVSFLGLWTLSFVGTVFLGFTPLDLFSNSILSESHAIEADSPNAIVDVSSSNSSSPFFIGSRVDHILLIVLVLLAIFLSKRQIGTWPTQWILELICIYLGLRYLYWRGFYTLNTQDTFSTSVSIILYLAEIYGFLAVLLFYVQVFKPTNPTADPPREEELPTVDIFVTIYNESLDILYRTLVACLAINYPANRKSIYVLDDGHQEEVKRLAEQLGCHYISREINEHAKAGNLNHGLACSSGDYVLILDCDHVPVRTFLKETIGFFQDTKLAFIQTPHFFYNPDVFQRNLRLERKIANEQELFFRIIQPGRDSDNASFYAGSGGVFRRSALAEINGFQVKTLTEDLHTSMVLHSKGYRSVYLNKNLAAGLAPESCGSYLKQRQRWTRGGVQVFLMDNPLWKRGLTFMQRMHYFASIFYFFNGWPRLIYLAAPLAYLLLNHSPVVANFYVLLVYYLSYFITSLIAFNRISQGFRNPFWSDVYETVMCFSVSWTAFTTFLSPEKIIFQVTPKGLRFEKTRLDWSKVVPHMLLSALLVVGIGLGWYGFWHHELNRDAVLLSIFWAIYNLVILVAAIMVARERPQIRSWPRLSRKIPCELSFDHQVLSGETSDLSETGMSLTLDRPVFLPPTVNVRLMSDFAEITEIKGQVIRNDSLPSERANVGIRFLDVSDAQHQSLIRQMYSSPNSWTQVQRDPYTTWRSFMYVATSSFRTFIKEKVLRRFSPRLQKQMVCELILGQRIYKGITENISSAGISVRLMTDEILSNEVTVQLYQEDRVIFSIRGEITRHTKVSSEELIYGIRFLEPKNLELSSLA